MEKCKKCGQVMGKNHSCPTENPAIHLGSYARKGHKITKEMKLKMSKAKKGDKHPNWKGGLCMNMKVYYRNWRLGHLIKVRFWDLRNKQKRRGAEGTYTKEEWENKKKKYNYSCVCCKRKKPEIKLTVDHIIPIKLGGTNYIDNIQPLCQSCNSHKNVLIKSFI